MILSLIEEDSYSYLTLSGDLSALKKQRTNWFFLNNSLQGSFDDTKNELQIPIEDSNLDKVYEQIDSILFRGGLEYSLDKKLAAQTKIFRQESIDFVKFSKEAKRIWGAGFNSSELQLFTTRLEEVMPNRRLFSKQLLASFHLAFSRNACNFSVPGSGKTSIVYGAYAFLKSLKSNEIESFGEPLDRMIVIGPLSSFAPWKTEYKKCFGINPSIRRLSELTPEERRLYLRGSPKEEITLMSYQTMANHQDDIEFYLRNSSHNVMMVVDEAHRIKNINEGIWSSAALKLSKFASSRVILTGTPAPNGYIDLINLFEFIWPNKRILGFSLTHLKAMDDNKYHQGIKKLINNLKPYFVRIRKEDLNLPEPIFYEPLVVEMGTYQRRIYDYILEQFVDSYKNSAGFSNKSEIFKAKIIRLRQAASNINLLTKAIDRADIQLQYEESSLTDDPEVIQLIKDYRTLETPAKFISARNIVEEIISKEEKVIIWVNFVQNMIELKNYLMESGIESELLYGEIPTEDDEEGKLLTREKIIREFHNPNSSYKVLIANPQAVGESISLHEACSNAIYLEKDYNAANYLQSIDRIHRYGLPPEAKVEYYFLESESSIDQEISERLMEKHAVLKKVIDEHDIPVLSLDKDSEDDSDEEILIKRLISNYVSRSN
jgi:SNF2 family DNA or RNA helicase